MRHNLLAVLAGLLLTGCSGCSMWDECDPGVVETCNYEGCFDCYLAQHECKANHEWTTCECIERDRPYPYDIHDPSADDMRDFFSDDGDVADWIEEDPDSPDTEVTDLDVHDLIDDDVSDPDAELDVPDADMEIPGDGGEE